MRLSEKTAPIAENTSDTTPVVRLRSWHRACSSWHMSNGTHLAEPEPRRKRRGEETTRTFWKPPLPETREMRSVLPVSRAPYLLAPPPWPKGQFRIDPEL
jgi:hypothetical protein